MTDVFRLPEIEWNLSNFDVIEIIEEGFVAYSQGKARKARQGFTAEETNPY